MKKKKLLVGTGLLLLLCCGAFFVVGSAALPIPVDPSTRGTPEYLTSEPITSRLPSFRGNIQSNGDVSTFVQLTASCVYRHGDELTEEEADAMFSDAEPRLRDALIMLLSTKSRAELESAEQLNILKAEIRKRLQQIVFPEKRAVVEVVLFREFQIQ